MRKKSPFSILRIVSLLFILATILITVFQLISFSRVRTFLPAGMIVAGVPVGGLDSQTAAERLLEVYSVPVEIHYLDQVIQLNPAVVDYNLDYESMLAMANLERTQKGFWMDFWDYLWGRASYPSQIPLSASYSEARLRAYLQDISMRYDQPALAAQPVPGSTRFDPGQSGTALDVNGSTRLIEAALNSLTNRAVDLPLQRTDPPRPAFRNLEVLLKQTLEVAGFDGLAGIYLLDLQTHQELHFAVNNSEDVTVQPDIAFTASSIIKIPIMVSAMRRMGDDPDSETTKLIKDMIELSGNEAADWLMDRVIDPVRGPLLVTEDMQALGLENTYLAGYFSFGSPLLAVIETPANQRQDVFTDPDPYSQTTPSDMGMLLEDIYQCSQNGGGALTAVFPGEIDQNDCVDMNMHLINNRLPMLLTAGLPEGTPIAHKHGWVTVNGIINTIGDAGIIYSPGGNYILVTFLYHPVQLIWDSASQIIADLSTAVYNYYNMQ